MTNAQRTRVFITDCFVQWALATGLGAIVCILFERLDLFNMTGIGVGCAVCAPFAVLIRCWYDARKSDK